MRKLFNIFLFTAIIVSSNILTSCGGSNSADQERIAQLEAQIAELQNQIGNPVETEPTTEDYSDSYTSSDNSTASSSSNGQNFIGTYEFTDEINNTWVLKLNSDETATIQLKGSDSPAYGSWSDWWAINNGNHLIHLSFDDQKPKVWFPAGEETCSYLNIINDGYIYFRDDDAKAKNPRKRLTLKKVK